VVTAMYSVSPPLLTIAYLLLRAATLTAQSDVAISDSAGHAVTRFS
jgi:hypothetical protein